MDEGDKNIKPKIN